MFRQKYVKSFLLSVFFVYSPTLLLKGIQQFFNILIFNLQLIHLLVASLLVRTPTCLYLNSSLVPLCLIALRCYIILKNSSQPIKALIILLLLQTVFKLLSHCKLLVPINLQDRILETFCQLKPLSLELLTIITLRLPLVEVALLR